MRGMYHVSCILHMLAGW